MPHQNTGPVSFAANKHHPQIIYQRYSSLKKKKKNTQKSSGDIDRETSIHDIAEMEYWNIGKYGFFSMMIIRSFIDLGMSHCAGRKWPTTVRAMEDADAVRRIRKAGCIPLLVSNTPEMCMCWETYNNVTGTTRNPYDTRRTAGGSSGGEVRGRIFIRTALQNFIFNYPLI